MEKLNMKKELDKIARDSWYNKGANALMIKYTAKVFTRFIRSGDILELGPAEGLLTEELQQYANTLTLVEGSSVFCDQLRKKFPHAIVINELFEDVNLKQKYDYIILGHVLEHVDDPINILKKFKKNLKPGGLVLAAVPNSHSIHRQAAVLMGLLSKESAMSEKDIHHGHKRVYNPSLFREHFLQAGYNIEVFGGYWLKPLSDAQLEASWTEDMMNAFFKLGELYPDIAAEIYIVASAND
jgi:2-polyprenyl-3-methyl-5-hydroxy-6-metoxy-1,4-benzoquinol methylase